jgi:hypothetical protein
MNRAATRSREERDPTETLSKPNLDFRKRRNLPICNCLPRGHAHLNSIRPRLPCCFKQEAFIDLIKGLGLHSIIPAETRGRGRMDHHHEAHGRSVKRIYIYPLCRMRSTDSRKTPRRAGSQGERRNG